MLIILSPAKRLDFKTKIAFDEYSQNRFLSEAEVIIKHLRKLNTGELSQIMHISPALTNLNYQRYRDWNLPFTAENAGQAIFVFNGDAYSGFDVLSLSDDDIRYSQQHLRILSALYGVIRPLDLIQPYRIEMGMKFSFGRYKTLYDFWTKKITAAINADLKAQGDNILVNLASQEYYKSLDTNTLKAQIITPVFKENKDGRLKIVSRSAKRARGMMSRFIIKNRITSPEELKLFEEEGYFFSERHSNGNEIVFVR